jgi:hypothetical protein
MPMVELTAASFDTFETKAGSRELEAWVRRLPTGTIVAGAVSDEGSVYLTRGAVAALGLLGVVGDLRGRYRESHAFVGAESAAPRRSARARSTSAWGAPGWISATC